MFRLAACQPPCDNSAAAMHPPGKEPVVIPFVAVVLLALPASSSRADDWVGQRVLPRVDGVWLHDANGKELMKWNGTAEVRSVYGEWLAIRHNQYPGPYVARV